MLAIKKPSVTFLPIATSKRISGYIDVPYGSHYTNAKFQPKRGPAIAVFAAAGTIGAGVSLGIGTFAGAMMVAGGVASALGAITGNKFLSTFGTVASLAGGVTGAFSAAEGGLFNYNPFTEGLGGSQLGAAAGKAKSFFSDVFGSGSSEAVDAMGVSGDAMVANVVDDAVPSITAESFAKDAAGSFGGGTSMGVDLASNAGSFVAKTAPKGGMFAELLGNKDVMNAVGGAADAYGDYADREQNQPLIDANVDLRNAQTGQVNYETQLAQNRYNNMQSQPNVDIGVNQNAQVYGANPVQGSPRIAVAMNGEVKYMTTDEYAAYKSQQSGGGLLQQGAA
jgi:hypothetical protein